MQQDSQLPSVLISEGAPQYSEALIRVSVEVPHSPRFMLSFTPRHFVTIKNFISFLCQETGLVDTKEVVTVGRPSYLIMLEDAILLNM